MKPGTAFALTLLLLGLLVGSGSAAPQKPRASDEQLSAALAAGVAATGAPGATAAIVENGQLVWSGAAGTIEANGGPPMQPNTRFAIASTTKTVTATMIMKLVEQGRLSLYDYIDFAEPRLPNARRITVRMLLMHRSGLGDYGPYLDRIAYRDPDHHWTRREVLSHVTHTLFPPGRRYEYSNIGYVTLGGVLTKVTGTGVAPLFRRMIGNPVGMNDSTFAYHADLSSTFAHPSYQRRNGSVYDVWPRTNRVSTDYWGPVWTDGGLASTSADLARFANALFGGRILRPRTVAQMVPRSVYGYGYGVYLRRFDGSLWAGHDGDYGGYETMDFTNGNGVTITAMTNVEESYNRDYAVQVIWNRVARALLDG